MRHLPRPPHGRLVPHWRAPTGFTSAGGVERPLCCANSAVVVKTFKPAREPRFGLTPEEEQQRAVLRESNVALMLAALGLPHVVRLFAYAALGAAPASGRGGGQQPGSGGGAGSGEAAGGGSGAEAAGAGLEGSTYALVLEYCELGSLGSFMRKLVRGWVGGVGGRRAGRQAGERGGRRRLPALGMDALLLRLMLLRPLSAGGQPQAGEQRVLGPLPLEWLMAGLASAALALGCSGPPAAVGLGGPLTMRQVSSEFFKLVLDLGTISRNGIVLQARERGSLSCWGELPCRATWADSRGQQGQLGPRASCLPA